jgi:hypothetical protein
MYIESKKLIFYLRRNLKLISSFNLSQSFNYTPYFFYKKRFCIWTQQAYHEANSHDGGKPFTSSLNICPGA